MWFTTSGYVFDSIAILFRAPRKNSVFLLLSPQGFPDKGIDYEKSRRFGKLLKAIPLRVDGMFVCLDEA
jgi:hypothetical protein